MSRGFLVSHHQEDSLWLELVACEIRLIELEQLVNDLPVLWVTHVVVRTELCVDETPREGQRWNLNLDLKILLQKRVDFLRPDAFEAFFPIGPVGICGTELW